MKTIIIGKESLLTKYLKIINKKTLVFSSRDNKDLEEQNLETVLSPG